MNRICLDTSAYTRFREGHAPVVEIVRRAREVGMPSIVLGELRAGFRLGRRTRESETELRAFLENPVVRILEVEDEASSHYADIFFELRHGGTPIPTNDIWIAALAAREGAVVVTYDGHFRQIRRIGTLILP